MQPNWLHFFVGWMEIYDIINLQKNREAISIPCGTVLRRLMAMKGRGRKNEDYRRVEFGKGQRILRIIPAKSGRIL